MPGVRRGRSRRARISTVQKDSGGCSNGEALNGKLLGAWLQDCDLGSGSKVEQSLSGLSRFSHTSVFPSSAWKKTSVSRAIPESPKVRLKN